MSISSYTPVQMTVQEAFEIQAKQVKHWFDCIKDAEQQKAFLLSVEEANRVAAPANWRQVPRGCALEGLYFLAIGKTKEDHQRHCASMD